MWYLHFIFCVCVFEQPDTEIKMFVEPEGSTFKGRKTVVLGKQMSTVELEKISYYRECVSIFLMEGITLSFCCLLLPNYLSHLTPKLMSFNMFSCDTIQPRWLFFFFYCSLHNAFCCSGMNAEGFRRCNRTVSTLFWFIFVCSVKFYFKAHFFLHSYNHYKIRVTKIYPYLK